MLAWTQVYENGPNVVILATTVGPPPTYAIVFFSSRDLSKRECWEGRPAKWPIVRNAVVSRGGTGNLFIKRGVSRRSMPRDRHNFVLLIARPNDNRARVPGKQHIKEPCKL